METLTVRDLILALNKIIKNTNGEALDYKVVLGDDEELNGVHEAYYIQKMSKDIEDFKSIDYADILDNKTILIS